MNEAVPAWLIDVGTNHGLALGKHEVIEVAEDIEAWTIPVGPPCCNRVIAWRDRLLPLADLSLLDSDAHLDAPPSKVRVVVVVAYQRGPEDPVEYAALEVRTMPSAIKVSDETEAPLPRQLSQRWRAVAIACFHHGSTSNVLVPDLAKFFAP